MKVTSIVAIISILIVISITVLLGIKLVRDIVRNNVYNNPEQNSDGTDESEMINEEYDDLSNNDLSNNDLSNNDLSYNPIEEHVDNSFDVEMPAGILIVQTVHTNIPHKIEQPIISNPRIEEISSRLLINNEEQIKDVMFDEFDKQANIPIDTSLNILGTEESSLQEANYINIHAYEDNNDKLIDIEILNSNSTKIEFEKYDGDDTF